MNKYTWNLATVLSFAYDDNSMNRNGIAPVIVMAPRLH